MRSIPILLLILATLLLFLTFLIMALQFSFLSDPMGRSGLSAQELLEGELFERIAKLLDGESLAASTPYERLSGALTFVTLLVGFSGLLLPTFGFFFGRKYISLVEDTTTNRLSSELNGRIDRIVESYQQDVAEAVSEKLSLAVRDYENLIADAFQVSSAFNLELAAVTEKNLDPDNMYGRSPHIDDVHKLLRDLFRLTSPNFDVVADALSRFQTNWIDRPDFPGPSFVLFLRNWRRRPFPLTDDPERARELFDQAEGLANTLGSSIYDQGPSTFFRKGL